jgi:hypothetical protein
MRCSLQKTRDEERKLGREEGMYYATPDLTMFSKGVLTAKSETATTSFRPSGTTVQDLMVMGFALVGRSIHSRGG